MAEQAGLAKDEQPSLLESPDLPIDDGDFPAFRKASPRLPKHHDDSFEHRDLVRRHAIRPAAIVRERDRIPDESEACKRRPNPEVVVFAAGQLLIETTYRVIHILPEYRQDANDVL